MQMTAICDKYALDIVIKVEAIVYYNLEPNLMEPDFTIEEVYNPKGTQEGKQNENLIFKVQWTKSK